MRERAGKAWTCRPAKTGTRNGEHGAEADHEFHSAIVESTGNATLVFLYSAITGLLKAGPP